MTSRIRFRTGGLTVVEILVALVVIAIAFAALAATQITNIRVTRDSKQASIATQVGNGAMESTVQAFLAHRFECDVDDFLCSGDEDVDVEGATYTASYAIQVGAVAPGLAQITVQVTEPASVTFNQLVSCMDVVPPPSFADPAPCPAPTGG